MSTISFLLQIMGGPFDSLWVMPLAYLLAPLVNPCGFPPVMLEPPAVC